MPKQSRSKAAAKATTSAQASPTDCAPPSPGPNIFPDRRGTLLAGGLIVLAALAAYHNSFSGPFILDDFPAITRNPTIKHLGSALSPPASSSAGGRPVINLTFALNYALGGTNVWGYHALNLLIHTLAGLALFGIVRRSLLECGRGALTPHLSRSRDEGTPSTVLALAVAVIWIVHPVQTEAVTYISQRAESLMGLFYLLTLYCFIRGVENGMSGINPDLQSEHGEPSGSQLSTLSSRLWFFASILACLLGAMSKEIIVTAPVMVLIYDRTFVAGSFREAWRLRWRYYLGLACTWLLLARLMTGLGHRGVGFEHGVTWWSYALTSCRSVALYCKLALWPHPLVFDYGTNMIQHISAALPYAWVLAALLVGTTIALWRWPAVGFLGVWFFVILAPTSSVVPVVLQPAAEHRLYLSLAAVVVFVVIGLHRLIGQRGLVVYAALAVGLGWLSVQRNKDYRSELAIWNDTVAKCPDNSRAYLSEGHALLLLGRLTEAREQFEAALRLKPDMAEAYQNLGVILDQKGRIEEAINDYTQAIRLDSNLVDAHYNLAVDLQRMGRLAAAIDQYREVVQATPDDFLAQCGLGSALAQQGHLAEAHAQFEETVRIFPESAEARYNLGNILVQLGRLPEATEQYELALRYKPDFPAARNNLGLTRKTMNQPAAGSEK